VIMEEIADYFVLEFDVKRVHDAFVDVGCHGLQLGREEISLWGPQS
jgi:hypothetical protein